MALLSESLDIACPGLGDLPTRRTALQQVMKTPSTGDRMKHVETTKQVNIFCTRLPLQLGEHVNTHVNWSVGRYV